MQPDDPDTPRSRRDAMRAGAADLAVVAGAQTGAARQGDRLADAEDLQFIASLMKPCHVPNQYASWIAPPRTGINKQAVDHGYVEIA